MLVNSFAAISASDHSGQITTGGSSSWVDPGPDDGPFPDEVPVVERVPVPEGVRFLGLPDFASLSFELDPAFFIVMCDVDFCVF